MAKLTTTQLADLIGITKQAVSKAAREGIISPCEKKGKVVYYDTEDHDVKFYIETNPQSGPREKPSKKPVKKPVKKSAKKKSTSKKVVKKTTKNNGNEDKHENIDELSAAEINRRAKLADMKKKEMQAEILQKKYIDTEFAQLVVFKYIEKLNSTIERTAGVWIEDAVNAGIESGQCTPKIKEGFINLCLEAADTTKKNLIKSIKKYEPKL